ncbi:MAG: acetate uptake transporter [Thermaerobacter sp.]|nr:acetate uptake transporter [Thermaerobacter sp.]
MASQIEDTGTRRVQVADPGPLGLAAFALTTFILSMANAGWMPAAAAPVFLTVALFYGGFTQIIAGSWEFFNRNTFGATAFSSYGAFWIALATLILLEIRHVVVFGAAGGAALGTFLLAWTIFTVYMMFASFRLNGALTAVFVALVLAFVCLTVGAYTGSATWTQWGGYTGVLTALLAWYTSAAGVINGVSGRTVLPVWPYSH